MSTYWCLLIFFIPKPNITLFLYFFFLQFMRYSTFVILVRICLVSSIGFPCIWLLICGSVDMLSLQVKWRENVVAGKPICVAWIIIFRQPFFQRPSKFIDIVDFFLFYVLTFTFIGEDHGAVFSFLLWMKGLIIFFVKRYTSIYWVSGNYWCLY